MAFPAQALIHRQKRSPKVSVILIDWGVRESFHSLHYLNRQTVDREDYELIWVEFYDRRPEALRQLVAGDQAILDQWLTLGYPDDYIFHKHRLYNVGLLAAAGDICVICDSDAMFSPTFIEKIIVAFAETPDAVVHVDEVRNINQALYPFCYPTMEQVLGPGCINWSNGTSLGLDNSPDMLHHANYGACMAARRQDLLAIGGADEHLDYLGYVCGPYELTFRLLNHGRHERWLRDEYLYHTWHPNQYGFNTDYQGPHDGMHLALLALEARATFRVKPCLRNPWLPRRWTGLPTVQEMVACLSRREEPLWRQGAQPPPSTDRIYWVHRNFFGFDMFQHAGCWYGLRTGNGRLDLRKLHRGGYREVWQSTSMPELQGQLPIDVEAWERDANRRWLPGQLWRRLRAQPIGRLPGRIARKARRLLSIVGQNRSGDSVAARSRM